LIKPQSSVAYLDNIYKIICMLDVGRDGVEYAE